MTRELLQARNEAGWPCGSEAREVCGLGWAGSEMGRSDVVSVPCAERKSRKRDTERGGG